jgi:DNA polymerase III alpha subunit (gram-positive type)
MKPLGVATLSQIRYVVFDIETTGLSANRDRIIQVAAVKIDGNKVPRALRSKVAQIDPTVPLRDDELVYNAFIRPGRRIPGHITNLTGITDAMVRRQPQEDRILTEFFEFVGDRILVAHNGIRFDVRFIQAAVDRASLNVENLLCLDTLWVSRRLYPDHRRHNLDAVADRFDLRRHYPQSFLNMRHNALVDVMLTAEALRVFLAELRRRDQDKLLLI